MSDSVKKYYEIKKNNKHISNNVEFNQHIGIFHKAIPTSICNKFIDLFELESNKKHQYNRQNGKKHYPSDRAQDTTIQLELVDINLQQKISTFFWEKIYPKYSSKYLLNTSGIFISGYKIQKTLPTEGYHEWHCENIHSSVSKRLMAYTLYLNNINLGGETEFLYQSLRLSPQTGTFCIFPSGYTHFHRGNPPLKETKYILTGWIELLELPPSPSFSFENLKALNPTLFNIEQIHPNLFTKK